MILTETACKKLWLWRWWWTVEAWCERSWGRSWRWQ